MRINVKHGLDLRISGQPRQSIEAGPTVRHVALLGDDYIGLRASLLVAVGDRVRAGQALFVDRRYPDIRYVSPAAGTVTAINRGAKRRLASVVVMRDGDETAQSRKYSAGGLSRLSADEIAAVLLRSGHWTALRSRPFDCVPAPHERPEWLFVTAIDTDPLAPDPAAVVREYSDEFDAGLRALSPLARRRTFLCTGVDVDMPVPAAMPGLQIAQFAGPHPAGLPGTHMHHLVRVSTGVAAWHINYQDVISIGRQFLRGSPWTQRVVAIAGPGVRDPRLVKAPIGASAKELLAGESLAGQRILSGPVLSGRSFDSGGEFLGRYHRQVALFDQQGSSARQPRAPLALAQRKRFARVASRIAAAFGGRACGLMPIEAFEDIWPMRIAVVPLLRALLANDAENAELLGCLALAEEDMALCSRVCPSNLDYSSALRATLAIMARENQ